MPGKLDHASVVAYRVGKWPPSTADSPPLRRRNGEDGEMELDGIFLGHRLTANGGQINKYSTNKYDILSEKYCKLYGFNCKLRKF